MDKEKEAQIKYLEDLLDIYADSQDYMTYYEVVPGLHMPSKRREEKAERYRQKREEAREQIIRLFL
jgi:hypothetical protein